MASASDVSWLLRSAMGIMTMQGGFALLEAGSVRRINVVNIMMKNIADMGLGGIIFWMIGYGLYAGSGSSFMGLNKFFLYGTKDYGHFIFNYSFAATSSTIDSGAIAERMNFVAYIILSTFTTGFVYPIVAHWIWTDEGWLAKLDFHDFAGSGAIHYLGAISACVAAKMVGKRRILQNYLSISKASAIFGEMSNPVYQLYGTFILAIGWFSFNCGSVGALSTTSDGVAAGFVGANTLIGGGFGMLFGCILSYYKFHQIRVPYVTNTLLGGLVAITANCDVTKHWEAAIIGTLAVPVVFGTEILIDYLGIDDPVTVIPVHGGCGTLSIIADGLFHNELGLFYTGSFKHLGVELLGLIVIGLWTGIITYLFLKLMDMYFIKIRVSVYEEDTGLDFTEHGVNSTEIARVKFMSSIVKYCEEILTDKSAADNPIKQILVSSGVKKGSFNKSWNKFKKYYGTDHFGPRNSSIIEKQNTFINRNNDKRELNVTKAAINDININTGIRRLSNSDSGRNSNEKLLLSNDTLLNSKSSIESESIKTVELISNMKNNPYKFSPKNKISIQVEK